MVRFAKLRMRVEKFSQWFSRRSAWQRAFLAAALCIVLILLVYSIFIAVLVVDRITGEDLVLFLKAETEYARVTHSQTVQLAYEYSTNNLAFCSATCNWEFEDLSEGKILSTGTDVVKPAASMQKLFPVTSAPSGLSEHYYQFRVSCVNEPSSLCRSEGFTRTSAALSVLNVTYGEEDVLLALVRANLPVWSDAMRVEIGQLNAIANHSKIGTGRAALYAERASNASSRLQDRYAQASTALANDDIRMIAQLIEVPPTTPERAAYESELAAERAAIASYQELLRSESSLAAAYAIANTSERAAFASEISAVADAIASFSYTDPLVLRSATRALTSHLAVFTAQRASETIDAAKQAQDALYADRLQACTLKLATCPARATPPTTLAESRTALEEVCQARATLPALFANASTAYALSFNPNATVQENEALYNVSAVRAQTSFAAIAEGMRDAARRGRLISTDPSLRLAVDLAQSDELAALNCSFENTSAHLASEPSLVLAEITSDPAPLPALVLPTQQCCIEGVCQTCHRSKRYPILLVHGHAFEDATSPELSITAFAAFAEQLQADGYVYAGNAFPRESLSGIVPGEFSNVPRPLVFTVTYYYDSYQEEGSVSFIPTKSESIEVYALRLRDVISVVQQRTGSDKVVLVSHSMGGLVSRKYLQFFGEKNVAALIMIGTPNAGVTGKVRSLCDFTGSDRECEDLAAQSVFLTKLNAAVPPAIPIYTFAGRGCGGDFDGIVSTESVALPYAQNTIIDGACGKEYLHSTMLQPALVPAVYSDVYALLENLTVQP